MRESEMIDRDAWSNLLSELLRSAGLTPEQAGRPNGPIDVNWRSIRRWLTKEQGASVRQVRDVCRAFNYPPAHGLVEVGFLTREEAGLAGPPRPGPVQDSLIRRIASALGNERLPDDSRNLLRRGIQHAFDIWLESVRIAAQEPPAPDRPTKSRRR